jgi:demethylmenaquinone methyltransferase/2-methoxy-6-polyprenyl-1,4-benzoquinol methylase
MSAYSRIKSLDTLRGVLIILMLFEHARQMLTGVVILETKAVPVSIFGEAFPLLIRSLSHLCAPGFFFLLGVGMVLRMRQATSQQVWYGFFKRGLLLFFLQFAVENGAWALPIVFRGDCEGGEGILLYCGVLFGLGGSMIITALLWRLKDSLLAMIASGFILSSLITIPESLMPWIGWLVGGFMGSRVEVLYPLLPWTGITLLGVLFARRGICEGQLQRSWMLNVSAILMIMVGCWILMDPRWSLSVEAFYKYPPSLSYVMIMMLALLLLLYVISARERLSFSWLNLLGRHALFAYLLHLYLLGFASLIFYHASMTGIILVALCVGVLTFFGCWWLERSKGLHLFNRFSPWYDWFMKRWGLYHVEALQQVLKPQGQGESLLDVAGGTGYLASCVADRYARVVVADLSPGMLSVARSRKLETVEASALELPFKDAEFDVVLCTDALHHIKQIERALDEMCRVLKPGGTLVIHEFDLKGWKGFFFYWFERLFVDDSVFITPEALQALLEKNGFSGKTQKLSALGYMYVGIKG